ncbi:MAG TPA: hypothetical protein PKA13_09075 [Geminicoccaceae bacterium]|nr:hypothetical protein [Geminicoccus sp.]HMU49916.1 hypothetical protein [Geminicoccaceae bacterium]
MVRHFAIAAVATWLSCAPVWAAEPALLIGQPEAIKSAAQLDLEAIKGLGSVTFETSTPWTDGKVVFDAVPGDKLAALLGSGTTVRATAIDEYSVDIPLSDFTSGKAHIAYAMNGEALPEDQFGPFWIVYRYDSDPQLADEAHQARSIWQLKSLTVR